MRWLRLLLLGLASIYPLYWTAQFLLYFVPESLVGYWLGQPYWGRGYAREAVAALLDYGFRTLGLKSVRAYTDPANTASQKVLLSCGLAYLGDIDLPRQTRNGAHRAPLFHITAAEASTGPR